jgi:hypothetical protein
MELVVVVVRHSFKISSILNLAKPLPTKQMGFNALM